MFHGLQVFIIVTVLFATSGSVINKQVKRLHPTHEAYQDTEDKPLNAARNAARNVTLHHTEKAHRAMNASRPKKRKPPIFSAVHDSADAVNFLHLHADMGQTASKLLVAYGGAMLVMVLCVTLMFYPMGSVVIFQVVLYVACLAFVKIALKIVYEQNFVYPKFITSVHLLVSSSAGFIVLAHRRIRSGRLVALPTRDELFHGLIPIACTFVFSVASENSALVFLSVAFSEVVGSTTPVVSFLLMWALGMGANLQLLVPLAVVVVGCVISVEGEIDFSGLGLTLLLLSIFFRGLKAVLQQRLMTGSKKEKFDPVTLMAWTCMFGFFISFYFSLATEGYEPYVAIHMSSDMPSLILALLGSAAVACALNLSGLFVIRQLGAVGMQMVSQMKALLVVIGGMALLEETFTNMQKMGFGIVLAGVSWYSHTKRHENLAGKGQ